MNEEYEAYVVMKMTQQTAVLINEQLGGKLSQNQLDQIWSTTMGLAAVMLDRYKPRPQGTWNEKLRNEALRHTKGQS